MRRISILSMALLLVAGSASPRPAHAQQQVIITHEMSTQDLNLAELQAFDQLATANRKMSRRLAANPHLADNESFLRRWPELNAFFAKYPGSKERFLADPGNYLADVSMHHRQPAKKKSEAAPAEVSPPGAAAPTAPAEKEAPPQPPPAAPSAPPAAPPAPPAAPPTNP